jgi:hypothetical protein
VAQSNPHLVIRNTDLPFTKWGELFLLSVCRVRSAIWLINSEQLRGAFGTQEMNLSGSHSVRAHEFPESFRTFSQKVLAELFRLGSVFLFSPIFTLHHSHADH